MSKNNIIKKETNLHKFFEYYIGLSEFKRLEEYTNKKLSIQNDIN
jgi:hypothetical protein